MKRLNGIQFRQGVEQAVGKIASDLGMKVTLFWDSGISTAGIDKGGKMYLANVADDAVVNQALVDKYTGFVVHELLHRKYTDFNVRGGGQYLDQLHNAVEDAWIERTGIAAGLTGNIEGLLVKLVNGPGEHVKPEYAAPMSVAARTDYHQYVNGFAIAPTVTLFEEDSEWSCDCGGKVDPCAHVAASIIRATQPESEEPTRTPANTNRGARGAPSSRLVYRLGKKDRLLTMTRLVVAADGLAPVPGPIVNPITGVALVPGATVVAADGLELVPAGVRSTWPANPNRWCLMPSSSWPMV